MPEKAKSSNKKEKETTKDDAKKVEEVAKHMRANVQTKKAIIKGENVDYFVGSKAVDCLLSSKWSQSPPPTDDESTPYFPDRDSVVRFCERMLSSGYFARGQKVEVKRRGKEEKEGESGDKEGAKKPTSSKEKKKYRILKHETPGFVDSPDEVFIWQYKPTSRQTYVFGMLVVVGAVAATLYPLWPDNFRVVIYYLSLVGLVLVGALFALYIVRLLLFVVLWATTTGKVHFWLFPNLNNDSCGFFESFQPLYSVKGLKKKKKEKKEGSDSKNEGDVKQLGHVMDEEGKEEEEEEEEEAGGDGLNGDGDDEERSDLQAAAGGTS